MQKYALKESEPDAPGQLYHLGKDPGETTNLYFKEKEKREEEVRLAYVAMMRATEVLVSIE